MHLHAASSPPGSGTGADRTQTVLRISLAATLAYVLVTFVAGLRAHSPALLSESGHNVSDFLALLLSFAAVYFQSRPADHTRTFGYQRAGVLAAFINAATLIVISIWIGIEAIHRLAAPPVVEPAPDFEHGRARRGTNRTLERRISGLHERAFLFCLLPFALRLLTCSSLKAIH